MSQKQERVQGAVDDAMTAIEAFRSAAPNAVMSVDNFSNFRQSGDYAKMLRASRKVTKAMYELRQIQ